MRYKNITRMSALSRPHRHDLREDHSDALGYSNKMTTPGCPTARTQLHKSRFSAAGVPEEALVAVPLANLLQIIRQLRKHEGVSSGNDQPTMASSAGDVEVAACLSYHSN